VQGGSDRSSRRERGAAPGQVAEDLERGKGNKEVLDLYVKCRSIILLWREAGKRAIKRQSAVESFIKEIREAEKAASLFFDSLKGLECPYREGKHLQTSVSYAVPSKTAYVHSQKEGGGKGLQSLYLPSG